jgi:ketosteroid isomerase-like protein
VSQTTKVVQVERGGQALVNAERLLSVVKEMTDDAIILDADPNMLHVRGARAHFRLLAMKPSDFPPFPAASEAKPFTVKATDLRRLVGQTAFAALEGEQPVREGGEQSSQWMRATARHLQCGVETLLPDADLALTAHRTCSCRLAGRAEVRADCGGGLEPPARC